MVGFGQLSQWYWFLSAKDLPYTAIWQPLCKSIRYSVAAVIPWSVCLLIKTASLTDGKKTYNVYKLPVTEVAQSSTEQSRVKTASQHTNWTDLNWPATSRLSYMTHSLVMRVSVTTGLAAAKIGRLVLSQFWTDIFQVATFSVSQSGTGVLGWSHQPTGVRSILSPPENFWNSICDLVHFGAIWWQLFAGCQTQYICNFAIKTEPIPTACIILGLLLLLILLLFSSFWLYHEILDIWRPGAGLARMWYSMAQNREGWQP